MKVNGTLILFKTGDNGANEILAHVQNATWNSSFELADTTDKDSGGYRDNLERAGIRDASLDVDGFATFEHGGNVLKLAVYLESRKKVNFVFDPAKPGTFGISGQCLFNEHSVEAPNEEGAPFTATGTVSKGWELIGPEVWGFITDGVDESKDYKEAVDAVTETENYGTI